MYEFPLFAIKIGANMLQKQHTCIHLLFWRLEVWNRFYGPHIKVSARPVSIGDSRTHSSSFPVSRRFWHSPDATTAVLGPHYGSLCFLLPLTSCFMLWFCQVHSGPSRKASPSQDPSLQFSSVTQCLTLCDPMNCSTSGLPVHHQLPELTQTHVHQVGDAI